MTYIEEAKLINFMHKTTSMVVVKRTYKQYSCTRGQWSTAQCAPGTVDRGVDLCELLRGVLHISHHTFQHAFAHAPLGSAGGRPSTQMSACDYAIVGCGVGHQGRLDADAR